MMQFVWFCASGDSFFLGAGLLVLAAALPMMRGNRTAAIFCRVLLIVGLTLVLLAAIPLTLLFYLGLLIVSTLLFLWPRASGHHAVLRQAGQAGIFILCTAAVILELRFHAAVGQPQGSPLWVVGDSISAGIAGPNERTWPRLLAAQYSIEVISLAEAGATVAAAGRQVDRLGEDAPLVLLEIGGNDLFAPTPPEQFRKDLSHLIERVVRPNRTVVLLELPVLPWDVGYTRIQRQVAKSLGVTIVPKRFLAGVLRRQGSSTDLAHLSPLGHQLMADRVARLLGLARQTASPSAEPAN